MSENAEGVAGAAENGAAPDTVVVPRVSRTPDQGHVTVQDGSAASRPELVVAIVSAIGTSVEPVVESLTSAFTSVNYDTGLVRVSDLLAQAHQEVTGQGGPQKPKKMSRARWLMDLGDQLREKTELGAAACSLALVQIRRDRRDATGHAETERPGFVTIIRSVKRADEIDMLRSVYGTRLLVVGVSASEKIRYDALTTRLKHENQGRKAAWYAAEATRLIIRDQKDDAKPLGQQVRNAFSKADAFVWLRPGHSAHEPIHRLVRAWFGEPFTTPTRDEQAMFHASAAQFRSAAAGRQVGAAIVDTFGEVLVTGTNDVPKPGGGQYWPGDDPDHRDFTLAYEMNDRAKYDVAMDVLGRLKSGRWLRRRLRGQDTGVLTDLALKKDGPLNDSRITDLLEFGRIMHAEMAAICTAARRGTPLGGSVLYTTTYPCHECARLIIGCGIGKVVFVDPYPKSQVSLLYRDQVAEEAQPDDDSKVQFIPFEGVAPVLFASVFRMNKRARMNDGTFEPWVPRPLASRIPDGAPPVSNEAGVLDRFLERYRSSQSGTDTPSES